MIQKCSTAISALWIGLLILTSGCQGLGSINEGEALGILKRPNRAAEEAAAWNPVPEPLGALLEPKEPLFDAYPSRAVQLPWGKIIGNVYWLDNRYAITTMAPSDGGRSERSEARIQVLDTSTGRLFDYAEGQVDCFWRGDIVYSLGLHRAYHRTDVPGWEHRAGRLTEEVPVPVSGPDKEGKATIWPIRPLPCRVLDPLNNPQEAEDKKIEGVFFPEPKKQETPVWTWAGLLPEHGFFAEHMPTRIRRSPKESTNAVGVWWFRPDGSRLLLPLNRTYEVGSASQDEWSPWLGRYVFSGLGISYSQARLAGRNSLTDASGKYGIEGNAVIFDPKTGNIVKIPRPRRLLYEVQVFRAVATRAGLLWQSGTSRPWGLYLSRGEIVRNILPVQVAAGRRPISVSPDGCRATVAHYDDGPNPNLAKSNTTIIDFCIGAQKEPK